MLSALTAQFERKLAEAALSRQQQMAALQHDERDHVARAQREALTQVIDDISAAQQRVNEGTFGTCTGCGQQIPVERLQVRPWSSTCITCAGR
jgi:DnaK suppressor protein